MSVVKLNTLGINYVSVSVQLYGPAVLTVRKATVFVELLTCSDLAVKRQTDTHTLPFLKAAEL